MKALRLATVPLMILGVAVGIGLNDVRMLAPTPRGAFAFAALGDAPYYLHEEWRYRVLLEHIDAHELAAVVHLGDIFWRPCSDAMLLKSREYFESLRHPVVYTPGDNEWVDCWEPRVGGYVPLERLAKLREVMYQRPPKRIALTRQAGHVENARWSEQGVVFATAHIVGSSNGMDPFPGRTARDDEEGRRRTEAATVWLRETFAAATNAPAVVIAIHARLPFKPLNLEYRSAYQPFLDTLEKESARFGKPVLVVHGDEHEYLVDHPLPSVPNLTRLEVPGSPDVGWVRVTVKPDSPSPFSFEKQIVPAWKYW